MKRELKMKLFKKTQCGIQHTGWSCNCCFHALDLPLKEDIHEYWLAILAYRGDYPELPKRPDLIKELFNVL
jgi:hypothetical protein